MVPLHDGAYLLFISYYTLYFCKLSAMVLCNKGVNFVDIFRKVQRINPREMIDDDVYASFYRIVWLRVIGKYAFAREKKQI